MKDADVNNILEMHDDAGWNKKGIEAIVSGNYIFAVDAYTKAIEINPGDSFNYYSRANVYTELGNLKQAIADYDQAIAIDPGSAEYYNDRGIVHFKLGHLSDAIKDFDTAINIDPKSSHAYFNRALVFSTPDHYKAIIDYDNGTYSHEVYRHEQVRGNHEQAIRDYSKAIEIDPQFADAYYRRALSHDKNGNHEKAIEDMKIASSMDHKKAWGFLKAHNNFPAVFMRFKEANIKDCLNSARESLKYHPDHFFTLCYYGFALLIAHKYEEAITIFNKCLEDREEYYFLLSLRGNAYYKLGKYDEAFKNFMRAFNLELNELFYRVKCGGENNNDTVPDHLKYFIFYFKEQLIANEIKSLEEIVSNDLDVKIVVAELKDNLSGLISHKTKNEDKNLPSELSALDSIMYYFDEEYCFSEIALFRRATINLFVKFGIIHEKDNISVAINYLRKVINLNPDNWFAKEILIEKSSLQKIHLH